MPSVPASAPRMARTEPPSHVTFHAKPAERHTESSVCRSAHSCGHRRLGLLLRCIPDVPPDGRARRPLGSPHVGGDHAVTAWPSAGDSVELDNGADDEGPHLVNEGDRLAVVARRHAHPLAERGSKELIASPMTAIAPEAAPARCAGARSGESGSGRCPRGTRVGPPAGRSPARQGCVRRRGSRRGRPAAGARYSRRSSAPRCRPPGGRQAGHPHTRPGSPSSMPSLPVGPDPAWRAGQGRPAPCGTGGVSRADPARRRPSRADFPERCRAGC